MIEIKRTKRPEGPVLQRRCKDSVEYLTFPLLEDSGLVEHLFTTRLGGVSQGVYASLNLSFSQGDDGEKVLENYRRVGEVLKITAEDMVLSHQTHTANIRLVTGEDRGKGLIRPRDYQDIDGLITRERGIALVTSFADCVPLYFVDPVQKAIGLAHSGWRGTVKRMGARMVEEMERCFGSRPEDLLAAIGPSICQECYEVGPEVAQAFGELERESGVKLAIPGRKPEKYQLDLWLANGKILELAGIPREQIQVTDICTCHNPELLFSHRASGGRRGGLCAFLMLKKEGDLQND